MGYRRRRRRSSYGYGGFPPYVTVAERRERADRKVAALRKKGEKIRPVEVAERGAIARTFWGKSWCRNLESYSDYSNRLPRGRSYVRHGAVLDLQILPGKVTSLVSGTSVYRIEINIKPLPAKRWRALCEQCAGEINSLVELLQGHLSDGVMEVLCRKQTGLFPAPREISLSCSCPDWATMCKHVAATLYGVGARLDEQPELLFRLRQVEEGELVAAAGQAPGLTAPLEAGDALELAEGDLSELFGIDIEPDDLPAPDAGPPVRRQPAERKPTARKPVKSKAAKTKAATRKQPRKKKRSPRGKAGERITARELTARGVPHSRIQSWLRQGVLAHSGDRGVYLTTWQTEARVEEFLAEAGESAAARVAPVAPRTSRKAAKRKPAAKRNSAARRKAASPRKPAAKRRARAKPGTESKTVTAKELTARGVPHSQIQFWIRKGVLERSGKRGVYGTTPETERTVSAYVNRDRNRRRRRARHRKSR